MNAGSKTGSSRRYLLLILLPLIVVISASLYTIVISLKQADRPVAENYIKNGLTVSSNNIAEQESRRLGLTIEVICLPSRLALQLKSGAAGFIPPEKLQLQFVHKIDPVLDASFELQGEAGNYAIPSGLASAEAGYWRVGSAGQDWSLRLPAPFCSLPAELTARQQG